MKRRRGGRLLEIVGLGGGGVCDSVVACRIDGIISDHVEFGKDIRRERYSYPLLQ